MAVNNFADNFNNAVAGTKLGHFFRLDGSDHPKARPGAKFLTELRAGITTFFTMSYIISVNAALLTDSGGTCKCHDTTGKDPICKNNAEYDSCLLVINRDLITATSAISCFASILMGLTTNLPISLAPGMGLNSYFTYQVVGFHGTGPVSYEMALTAVFVEGLIFVGLSLFGLRQWLAKIIPASIKIACSAGIGLYLCFIGLTTSAGLGAISGASNGMPVDIAGCIDQYKDEFGHCTSHKMQNPTLWIGFLCGGLLTSYLMMYKVKSAMMIGIMLVSILSWPRGTSFTYFPDTPQGDERFQFFKKVVNFHTIQKTFLVQDWSLKGAGGQFALGNLFTFLYVDILDCTGTLYSMVRFCGAIDPESGDFERSTLAYTTDASCISLGALLGSSPVTAYIESGAGIAAGGRTGITAICTGICFFISLFFAPIFASIPPWATGGALVLVGCMMMKSTLGINWSYIGDCVPAFITLMFMPFSYSISYGLIAGILSYIVLNGLAWFLKLISRGKIAPADEDLREYWSYKSEGHIQRPWYLRALNGKRRFWEADDSNLVELSSVEIPKNSRESE